MLSIIIVNYFSLPLIRSCLLSLIDYHPELKPQILIVNNGEKEHDKDTFCREFSYVEWHEMGYNSGFARANNFGIKKAQHKFVLLLNPDIVFIQPVLSECIRRLEENSKIAAGGVQLLNEDRSFQISGSYFIKGGLNHLIPIPYWGALLRKLAISIKTKTPHLKLSSKTEHVDWINGAFILTTKDVVSRAGYLDEDFFMYSEEIEWCSRLKKVGELVLFGDLRLVHLLGKTSKKTSSREYEDVYSKKGLQIMLGHHLRVRKQHGILWLLILYSNYFFGAIIGLPCSIIETIFMASSKPIVDAYLFFKNVVRLGLFLPRIVVNVPYFYKVM